MKQQRFIHCLGVYCLPDWPFNVDFLITYEHERTEIEASSLQETISISFNFG